MKEIEILAPAGSYESLVAAINASCDAVYIGGAKFGARAFADNLSDMDMLKAIDYTHIHNKKIYLTVNTLLKDRELKKDLYDYLLPYYEQGLDAVILQDVGVLDFIHEEFPDLPIHASTQMSLTMAEGAKVLKSAGVTRLVNARELSLAEIKAIRAGTDMELESFVHGALCYCYSGQCLMSSMFGGRSGNRGRCAQPCRMPYELYGDNKGIFPEEEKYLLSPKDICTLEKIPDLVEAGINSFKIEGRMKRPEYTAGVTYTYRKYVDRYLEWGKEKYLDYLNSHQNELKQDMTRILDLYNRGGFSKGYYAKRNGREMMALDRPNHFGVCVGKVKEVKNNQASILLTEDINAQDILEIRDFSKGLYEFTVKKEEKAGTGYKVNVLKGSLIKTGQMVYRTKNNYLLEELAEEFIERQVKEKIRGKLTANLMEPLRLELTLRDISVQLEGDLVLAATNQPMTKEKIEKQLQKTKDTPFEFQELIIDITGEVFIPVQKLNEIRREALEELAQKVAISYHRGKREKKGASHKACISERVYSDRLGIEVAVQTIEQVEAAFQMKEVTSIYIESDMVTLKELDDITRKVKGRGKKCYIMLPYIFRKETYQLFSQNKSILAADTINGYILRNYEEYYFACEELKALEKEKELITDYNLYTMNEYAIKFWKDRKITGCTAPVELNYKELKEMSGMFYDMIVYGYQPLMISAQCLAKTAGANLTKADKKKETLEKEIDIGNEPCCGLNIKKLELIDRYQKKFKVARHCRDCYNVIYNSQCFSLLTNSSEVIQIKPHNIRLQFRDESGKETKIIIQAFIDAYLYGKEQADIKGDFTRGHFKRGVD